MERQLAQNGNSSTMGKKRKFSAELEQPPAAIIKKKPACNFSIESIMKTTERASLPEPQEDQEEEEDEEEEEAAAAAAAAEGEERELASYKQLAGTSPISPAPSSFSGGSSDVELSSGSSPASFVGEEASNGPEGVTGTGNNKHLSTNNSTSLKGSGKRHSNASSNHLLRQQVCHDPRLKSFECQLDNLDLWHRFHPLDTEMIITKQGRRMFPPVRVTFSLGEGRAGCPAGATGGSVVAAGPAAAILNSGQPQLTQTHSGHQMQLNGREKYQVLMDILPYDNKRYRYAYHKSSWQQAGKADPPSPTKLFLHPDGPFTLEQLKRQVISFEKIKLTNNDANKHGFIVLNSMHKYQPRIHLVLWRGKDSQNLANAPISQLEQETYKTFIFSETIFTAVTAYQNHSITKLKIDSNPFAKGFRDSSRLTDLELESMQDLISDGQCPFSPPRAPPHGFPHFLFNQPAPSQLEDPSSALLRERTIMALDSFLQQQQQQQHQQQQSAGSNPHRQPSINQQQQQRQSPEEHNQQNLQQQQQQQQQQMAFAQANPFGHFLGLGGLPGGPPASSQSGPNLEQLIMQQQQFAAAMAAAGAHHPLQSLFGLPGGGPILGQPPPAYSGGHLAEPPPPLYNGPQLAHYPASSQGSAPPTSKLEGGSSPTSSLSTPSAGKELQHQGKGRHYDSSPHGGASSLYPTSGNLRLGVGGLHPKHLELMIQQQQQHQHQMASLSSREERARQPVELNGGGGGGGGAGKQQQQPNRKRDFDSELDFLIKNYAEKSK